MAGSIMTAALNFHAAALAAALQQQQLAAVPAAQLLLSALLQALAPGPVHLHQLLCLIHGLLGRIFTQEEAILVLIFSSTLCPLILYSSNIYSFDHSKMTFSSAQPKTLLVLPIFNLRPHNYPHAPHIQTYPGKCDLQNLCSSTRILPMHWQWHS